MRQGGILGLFFTLYRSDEALQEDVPLRSHLSPPLNLLWNVNIFLVLFCLAQVADVRRLGSICPGIFIVPRVETFGVFKIVIDEP
jgi:hypothetical protein